MDLVGDVSVAAGRVARAAGRDELGGRAWQRLRAQRAEAAVLDAQRERQLNGGTNSQEGLASGVMGMSIHLTVRRHDVHVAGVPGSGT